jgi:hypothetical protein
LERLQVAARERATQSEKVREAIVNNEMELVAIEAETKRLEE